jgi:hypothetical protein
MKGVKMCKSVGGKKKSSACPYKHVIYDCQRAFSKFSHNKGILESSK